MHTECVFSVVHMQYDGNKPGIQQGGSIFSSNKIKYINFTVTENALHLFIFINDMW